MSVKDLQGVNLITFILLCLSQGLSGSYWQSSWEDVSISYV